MKVIKKNLGMVMGLLSLLCVSAFGETLAEEVRAYYTVGAKCHVNVSRPKPGFIGSPFDFTSSSTFLSVPSEHDFQTWILEVTILDIREDSPDGAPMVRVVLQYSEPEGMQLCDARQASLFYLDFMEKGARGFYKDSDNGVSASDAQHMVGSFAQTAFPITLAFRQGIVFGHIDGDHASILTKRAGVGGVTEVDAALYKFAPDGHVSSLETLPGKIAWYTSNTDAIARNENLSLLSTETQKWSDPKAWMWDEMVRYDKDGNITMRCKKLTNEEAEAAKVTAKAEAAAKKAEEDAVFKANMAITPKQTGE